MTLPELEPIKFRPFDVVKTFEQFEKKANGYSEILSDVTDIDQYVERFIKEHPEFGKLLRTKELAAKEIRFELHPIIAKFSTPLMSMPHETKLVKKLNHIAFRPIDGVEGVYYRCDMFVPIPTDMLNFDSEERLLKEHVNLIDSYIDKELKHNIYELKPRGIVTRLCGWDGSWIVYSYAMNDDPSVVWSTPLLDSPYKNTQPFFAVKDGEFVILEDDLTQESHTRVEDIKDRVNRRIRGINGLELKEQKAIPVNMEWVIAHAINTDAISRVFSLEHATKDLGAHIPDLTLHEENFNAVEILEFMKKDITCEPAYNFKLENIRKFTIPRK